MKPKEKIYEFDIQNRLTGSRRKAISQFFEEHGGKGPVKATATWDKENENLLHIHTFVVSWEIYFSPKLVEVYGSGPFWAKLLFTDKKRAQLRLGIQKFLEYAGFFRNTRQREQIGPQAKG